MKKAFDQTVRDLKREVNKKVLKVPGVEQKILDATSNEPWGPHGSLLADIAEATRNNYEYQKIMSVIWKRINDTGKNWRHVYKALTVLEYLVGHGSEGIIDEIRVHEHQITILSNFQYIDSNGRDQGSNIRMKSQSLLSLVNDKEKIQEVRDKAFANRDKYRSTFSTGRPGSYSSPGGYGDQYHNRYESRSNRDEDRYGNGSEREWGYRDDDRYARTGDPYSRDGERYGKDSDEWYNRDSYKDNDYRGGHGRNEYQHNSRNRSAKRDGVFDDDHYSSRSGGGRVDDPQLDEIQLEGRQYEPNLAAPPSYEEATQSSVQAGRNGADVKSSAMKQPSTSKIKANPPANTNQTLGSPAADVSLQPPIFETNGFDEFEPRGSVPVDPGANRFPAAANSLETDFFGSASTLMPMTSNTNYGTDFCTMTTSNTPSQPVENPFGDAPFKATMGNLPSDHESFAPIASFQSSIPNGGCDIPTPVVSSTDTATGFGFGNSSGGNTYGSVSTNEPRFVANPAKLSSDVLAKQPSNDVPSLLTPQGINGISSPQTLQGSYDISSVLAPHSVPASIVPLQTFQSATPLYTQGNVVQSGSTIPFTLHPQQAARPAAPTIAMTTQVNLLSQKGPLAPVSAPALAKNPLENKFEAKSSIWADTLSRGLIDINISGSKMNPNSDIGVDFESIKRMEKRNKEGKSSAASVASSTTTMGKAMGSGSGIGRAGASGLPPPPNPLMGMGMGMGGYGGSMNQTMAMGGGGMNMAMGMNQGMPMQPGGPGMAPGVGYNPMMGMGGYNQQQPPYGSGFR